MKHLIQNDRADALDSLSALELYYLRVSLDALGLYYIRTGDLHQAKDYLEEAMALYEKSSKDYNFSEVIARRRSLIDDLKQSQNPLNEAEMIKGLLAE